MVALFFDVSGGELMVILLFVLLFFGSKGIPGVARTLGRTMRQLRDATAEVQREIERGANDVKRGYEEQRRSFRIEVPENAVPQKQAAAPEVQPAAEEPGTASMEPTVLPSDPATPPAEGHA